MNAAPQTILVLDSAENGMLESTLRALHYDVLAGLTANALQGSGFDVAVADFSVLRTQASADIARQSKVPLIIVASAESASAALDWARQNGCGLVLRPCESALNLAIADAKLGRSTSEAAALKGPAPGEEIETLADCEKRHIFAVLERCHWNRTHAAAKLAISVRTLRNKLKEYRQAASVQPELAVNR